MSPLRCEEARELAAELALDVLPGDERARVLEHLAGCTSCQAVVDELSLAADGLLLALPEADPPPGFAERTVAAMRPARARAGGRHWLVLTAAAVVLGLAERSRANNV